MIDAEITVSAELAPPLRRCIVVGAIGFLLCLVGAFFDRQQFFQAYLVAYMFWLGVPLGCLGILMIHHLVGGTWGFVIQRALESAVRTFPVLAVLFVPLLFCMPGLCLCGQPNVVAHDPVLL